MSSKHRCPVHDEHGHHCRLRKGHELRDKVGHGFKGKGHE